MPVGGLSAWRERWFRMRDSLLMNGRFQAFASRFPLTRPLARRRVNELFDLCAGFVYSQVLLACVELRLFERVRVRPLSVAELAAMIDMDESAVHRLLVAAASLRLLRVVDDGTGEARYGLGDLGAALLGNPGVMAMIEHHRLLYVDLRDPVAMLRGRPAEALAGFWPYARSDQPGELASDGIERYTALMAASQDMIASQVIAAYPLHRHRCVLDVGGGNGTFLAAVARSNDKLALKLFDLPAVAQIARDNLEELGLSHRVEVVGGSFTSDALPTGADIITLVRIIHDHDDGIVRKLLRAAHAALPPGGTLLIAEPMSGTRGGEPIADAYFGMYLHAMGSGRARTPEEITALLREAGFGAPSIHATHLPALVRVLACVRDQDRGAPIGSSEPI